MYAANLSRMKLAIEMLILAKIGNGAAKFIEAGRLKSRLKYGAAFKSYMRPH